MIAWVHSSAENGIVEIDEVKSILERYSFV